jgi:hypothetical protein
VFGSLTLGAGGTINLSSLDGATGFVINGATAGDRAGISVAGLGDVNGDGIDDLGIGASFASPGGRVQAGAAWVIFGRMGIGGSGMLDLFSLAPSAGISVAGLATDDRLGTAVAGRGDINHDGLGDLLITAERASALGRLNCGVTYVIYGAPSLGMSPSFDLNEMNGENGFKLVGATAGAFSGTSAAFVGDVNNDTKTDLAVGATVSDPLGRTDAGEVYIVYGGSTVGGSGTLDASLLAGTTGFVVVGAASNDRLGYSVAGSADVNHDGIDDLLIGAIRATNIGQIETGRAYVLFGAEDIGGSGSVDIGAMPLYRGTSILGADIGGFTGYSVAGVGDMDSDGLDDFAVSAVLADPITLDEGKVYVMFGRYHSSDCNMNNQPDECDIAACPMGNVACSDCNANGVPDSCDIGLAGSLDCNLNGIPDECEEAAPVVDSTWFSTIGSWSVAGSWCPDVVPNNDSNHSYRVLVSGAAAEVTLDISPTIIMMTMNAGAVLQVNDGSGANVRTLSADSGIVNNGILRATDRERLVLDTPLIDQLDTNPDCATRGGGILEAVDGAFSAPGTPPDPPGAKSILEINGSVVLGGRARTIGPNSEIHLIGGAELVDVCVEGVVVPDGQAGGFAGRITNSGRLRIAPGGTAFSVLAPIGIDEMLEGNGGGDDCVTLGGQSAARLGDFKSAFTNAASHQIDGAGIIFGGLANEGAIVANHPAGQHLILFPPGVKTSAGILSAAGGGVLRIAAAMDSTGTIVALTGGTVLVNQPVGGTGSFATGGGSLRVAPGVAIAGFTLMGTAGGLVEMQGSSTATLSGPAAFDNGSTFQGNAGSSALLSAAGVDILATNGDGADVLLDGTMRIVAPGTVRVVGCLSPLRGCSPPVLRLAGAATANSGSLEVRLGGEVQLDGGAASQLTVSSLATFDSGGMLRGAPGSSATLTAGNLDLLSTYGDVGGQVLLESAMRLVVPGSVRVMACGIAPFRGCSPPVLRPTLNIGTGATAQVGGDVLFGGDVAVQVAGGATFRLGGDFDNQSTSPGMFDWTTGPLIMDGAPFSTPQTFELAGRDFGPGDPAGFIDNFEMGLLRIEPGRTVDFRNDFSNQPPAGDCEVLYVDTLSLGAGATLRLHGCNLYYRTLVNEGATIDTSGGGALVPVGAGRCDVDADGGCDDADVTMFVQVLLGQDGSPVHWIACDLNVDGRPDGLDIPLMAGAMLGF